MKKGKPNIHINYKLLIVLGLTIWIFLFLTTISKSYSWVINNNIDVSISFLIVRAFWIWGTLALFFPIFVIIARFFHKKLTLGKAIGAHIFTSLLLVPVYANFYWLVMKTLWYTDRPWSWEFYQSSIQTVIVQFILVGPLSYALIIVAWHFKTFYESYRKREINNMEMEAELSLTRLQILKNQLHPHFLFNTLHNVNSLIAKSVKKAERILVLLKQFLNISITRVNELKIPLAEEIKFTNSYLEIEKIRFSDRLTVITNIRPDTLEALVPSFLLQPLVENAVRHGIGKKMDPGTIRIISNKKGGNLVLVVEDSGPGLGNNDVTKGLGLGNIEERLKYLYENYVFSLRQSELGGLKVHIEFPIN